LAITILTLAAAEGGDAGKLQGRDLTVLVEETGRLERAIQRFLDFARPPRLERYNSDVRGVLQQTVDLVAARAARQGVQIHQEVPDGSVNLHADPEQIRQVFLNTLLNSLDMLPKGGNIRLSLGVEAAAKDAPGGQQADRPEEASRWVAFQITDDGPGIPVELVERVFDPFVTTKETGLGLGLAICRRIVEAHGGTIRAANVPGGGADFLVRLPLEIQTRPEPGSESLPATSRTV
jgi:signal transduction histidine kinase